MIDMSQLYAGTQKWVAKEVDGAFSVIKADNRDSAKWRLENDRLFSLDIETRVAGTEVYKYPNGTESKHAGGLDARMTEITAISITANTGDAVCFTGSEHYALDLLTHFAKSKFVKPNDYMFRSSLWVGWNIMYFDLPFLAYRYGANGQDAPIMFKKAWRESNLNFKTLQPKYGYPEYVDNDNRVWIKAGNCVTEWDRAELFGKDVLDIYPYFKSYADKKGIKCSLKDVAKSFGLKPIEIDIMNIDNLTPKERMCYNMSDTEVVLDLIKIGLEEGLFN